MYKKIIIPILGMALFFAVAMVCLSADKSDSSGVTIKKGMYEPIVVIELFTSQGCSSCPPADVLLQKMKQQYPNKVFALSYHVDYWNYIGWKDPFSSSQFTTKQSFYNRKLGYRGNYTPEVIVNGKEHFVGSSASKMQSRIKKYGQENALNKIELKNVHRNQRTISFDFKVDGDFKDKQLRSVLVLDERTTSVKHGENRNRTLTNSNIVVLEKYLDKKSVNAVIEIPDLVNTTDGLTLMLFTETESLDITGAAKQSL